jgi:hypothetical protein
MPAESVSKAPEMSVRSFSTSAPASTLVFAYDLSALSASPIATFAAPM